MNDPRWVDDSFRVVSSVDLGITTDAAGNQALVIIGTDAESGIEHRWLVPSPLAKLLPEKLSETLDEFD